MKYIVWLLVLAVCWPAGAQSKESGLSPWPANPRFWSYNGNPVRLVGGSDDDNLFQTPDVVTQLDAMQAAGANYIRNTMSDRRDKGFEVYPFAQVEAGKYDLTDWNPTYWERFETLLRECAEREIFVQIEVWDRFDYSRENWDPHPYNPKNNVNYTFDESGFKPEYPNHPGANEQPFFFTVPELTNNQVVLPIQQAFVRKMLSISLKYPNVLYCIDNETSGDVEWARYWVDFIRDEANKADRHVYITEMWDDWDVKGGEHRETYNHPERYDFVDVSQNNHNTGDEHWANLMWVRNELSAEMRPFNHVKIYGADGGKYGNTRDGLERFWRCGLAGAASFRFHRPDSGIGFSEVAARHVKAFRMLEAEVDLLQCDPDATSSQLKRRSKNEAYLSRIPGNTYVVYMPDGGDVGLDLTNSFGNFSVRWLDIDAGEWTAEKTFEGNPLLPLKAPKGKHMVAVVKRLRR